MQAQNNIKYGENYIVFEAEDTNTPLGNKWQVRTPSDATYLNYLHNVGSSPAPINNTYLEYTGPWLGNGSELEYKFTCPKTGTYQVAMRLHSPLRESDDPNKGVWYTPPGQTDPVWWEKADARNDFYIKMEGNYTSGSTKHTETDLRTFHKLFGRGGNKWGTCINLEHNGNNGVFYNLVKGQEYSFYLKGRSATAIVDYITLYDTSYLVHNINNQGPDLALQLPEVIRPYVTPTTIAISPSPATVRFGASYQLNKTITPTNGNPSVIWSTSNDQIVSVNQSGLITAIGTVGQKATITATSSINGLLMGTSEVTIIDWYAIPIQSIAVTPENPMITEGQNVDLIANVLPVNADDKSVLWTSSNTAIATVDVRGKVTALKEGTVTIRATSNSDATIFGETSVVVGVLIEPFVNFDNNSNYLNRTFKTGETMNVGIEYHAGSGQTVTEAIAFKLRHIQNNSGTWKILKDVNVDLPAYIGTTSGTVTTAISLAGLTPSASLPSNEFYYLFVKCTYTNGKSVNKGLQPIVIVENLSVEDVLMDSKKIRLFPNPTTNNEISISGIESGVYQLKVYNLVGAEMINESLTVANDASAPVNLKGISQGTYIIIVTKDNKQYQTLFIVK